MSKSIPSLTGTLQNRSQVSGSMAVSMLRGKSAYEIAVANGFEGTEEEWLASLKGDAATIELGTVTYGVPTSVTNSGDENHAVFDFVLPTGDNASDEVAGIMKLYDNPGYNKDGSMTQAAMTTMLGNKVDKVTGKGLSTNDYTTEEKEKLAGIEEGANKYVLPKATATVLGGIKVGENLSIDSDGFLNADAQHIDVDNAMSATSENPVQNKVVDSALVLKAPLESPALTGTPTAPTAAAGTNTDQIATTKFVTSAVSTAIGDLAGVEFSIVTELPATGDASTIYLVSASDGSGNDVYDEYIWLAASATFEKIGSTRVDLSNYYNKDEVDAVTREAVAEEAATIETEISGLDGRVTALESVTVDDAMSATSTNPVQNKVINTVLGLKAPLDSPTLTGAPTAPTATAGTNTTQIATTEFVTSAVSDAIGKLAGIKFSIVTTLPSSGSTSTIYLVSALDGKDDDIYDEYIWLSANNKFEKIGTTRIDLSNYYNTSNMTPITSAQIDAVCV